MRSTSAACRRGSCLCAFRRLKPLAASCIASPAQRRAIDGARQYFTFRQTRRTVPILDNVYAGERAVQFRRQAEPRHSKHLVDSFQDRGGNALPIALEAPGERRSVSALSASSIIDKIKHDCAPLLHFPLAAPARENFASGLRVSFSGNYALYFIHDERELVNVRVLIARSV